MSITCLVVDDEPLARERIRNLLAGTTGFGLVGECRNGREAVAAIRRKRPMIVFLDVQMPELDGFGVIEQIGAPDMPIVVFVTAYDQHALRAFDVEALDYLLKPFSDGRFRDSLARCQAALNRGESGMAQQFARLLETLGRRSMPERIAIRSGGRITFVRTDDIDWIESSGNYVRLHVGESAYLLREAIGALESRLDGGRFVRIHRSAIVNVQRIREMHALFHGEYAVKLTGGAELTLSRAYRHRFEDLVQSRG